MRKAALWLGCIALTFGAMCLCICVGSVGIPLSETLSVLYHALLGQEVTGKFATIILTIRLPRVLCVGLTGACLSLSGCAMQGLLRNPLADGSTLGISSGASLGAAVAILTGFTLPGLSFSGTAAMAMLFAFLTLVMILTLAWSLDRSLETNSIILIGVIFSMFISALMSLLVTFSGTKLRAITFWTMGSLASAGMTDAALLLGALLLCGGILLAQSRALNALSLGEAQAAHLGVSVRRVKLTVMIAVSVLIGLCVSIGGCIGFVGLVTPHMLRMIFGPDHKRLLPLSVPGGAVFLMLCDLAARTVLSPIELPIGVVTSLIGAVVFVFIFYRTGKGRCRPC
ncbi:MAG: iron ABC transporter permease [Clostridia bacterium]|nr:iron ABC transporter permease [Clostridia bacterium]